MIRSDNFFECYCGMQVDCSTDDGIRAHIGTCPKYQERSNITRIFKNMQMELISTEDLKVIAVELTAWCDDIRGKLRSRAGKRTKTIFRIN